jgi:preprotein translocase subunit SecG
MQQVLIVIHLILVTALVGVVLLQRSEGGALGMGGSGNGGSGGFMTGRGQANALTRATAILATGFFITSLLLAVVASSNRQPKSILDSARPGALQSAPASTTPGVPTAPAPGGGVLDELRRMQGDAPAQPALPTQTPVLPGLPQAPISR